MSGRVAMTGMRGCFSLAGRFDRDGRRAAVLFALFFLFGVPLRVYAQGCPSGNIDDVLRDPRVQEALDNAWRDSHEGADDEHEEGGWVQQCRMENVLTGDVRYFTQVLPWPHGTIDGSGSSYRPRQDATCRTVASYHTHPGPAYGEPGADGYSNERPSPEDILASAEDGLPGIIRYGSGDGAADFTYGYNGMADPRDPGWGCPERPWRPARGFGDPHMETFDGLVYDFMGIGDFALMRAAAGDVEVQARMQPYGQLTSAAITTGIVIRDGRDRVEWQLGQGDPIVNGTPRPIASGQTLKLRSRAVLRQTDEGLIFISSVGDRLRVDIRPVSVDYALVPAAHRAGKVGGLFGNFDGDPGNDLRTADHIVVASKPADPPDHRQPLYARFGESWRVAGEASLFSTPYRAPAGVDVSTFPRPSPATEEARAAAVIACRAAGIVDPAVFDACVFDRAQTGSAAFTAGAVETDRQIRGTVPLAKAGTIEIERELTGRLEGETRQVSYAIALPAGTYLFDARGSRATSMRLLDTAGDDRLAGAGAMDESPPRIAVPEGRYQLAIALVPDSAAGRFRLRIRRAPTPEGTPLSLGTRAGGTVETPGQVRAYRLQLEAGRYDFEPTATGELWWSLTDAAGNELFDANQRVYMERAGRLPVPASGTYTLTVSGRAWVGTGTYQIVVNPAR